MCLAFVYTDSMTLSRYADSTAHTGDAYSSTDQFAEYPNKVIDRHARFLKNAQCIQASICLLEQLVYMSVPCKIIADMNS